MAAQVMTDEPPVEFGSLLRQHRTKVGLTQRELADLSTISVRAIRDLEQGRARRPRQDTVRLIADGLRLGRQARVDLETAACPRKRTGALRSDYDADLAEPPTAPDAMVGREPETEALVTELACGHRRLVDLVGLSGVGKTRLAVEVARRLHEGDGLPVLWAAAPGAVQPPAPAIRDDALATLVRECVQDLFAAAGPGRTRAVTDLAELVGDRPTLLVIDGIGMRRPRADRVGLLLRDSPGLRVLVTSAPPCELPDEWTFLVAPLAVPDPQDTEPVAAARLFADHARRAGADPTLVAEGGPEVAEVCRLLDGMPVALTAVASWLAVYGMDRVLDTLRADPAALLEHISAGRSRPDPRDGLARCLFDLASADRQVLLALCDLPDFTLDDVVTLTGRSLPECGRTVRSLLAHGVLRVRHEPGRSVFRVLNLVRAVAGGRS
jgi:transcriptional regulator with XRE-family HTH domain